MNKDLFVVYVRYQPNERSREYAYLYDPLKLELKRGDDILVPVGSSGKQARATVSKIKGSTAALSLDIKYKTLDPEGVAMSKILIEKADEVQDANRRIALAKKEHWEDLANTIEDF